MKYCVLAIPALINLHAGLVYSEESAWGVSMCVHQTCSMQIRKTIDHCPCQCESLVQREGSVNFSHLLPCFVMYNYPDLICYFTGIL